MYLTDTVPKESVFVLPFAVHEYYPNAAPDDAP